MATVMPQGREAGKWLEKKIKQGKLNIRTIPDTIDVPPGVPFSEEGILDS
ncbi:MAG: hypothetical protein ACR2NM_08055 [Bythopirellula sp.]